ncbi:MAG TPA: phosphatidylglycerophosphatase A [Terriglobales bacterium]|nr:phosphatidylglycerophosphatase A [Terriglobales bacterium]
MNTSRTEAAPPTTTTRGPLWAWLAGTFFGVGTLRPGPGTWGSTATVLLWAGFARYSPVPLRLPLNILLALLAVAIGIPAATRVARASGKKDPQQVVIDEVAGQLITLVAAPIHWKPMLAGLILFRVFDMWKPFPVRNLEKLPEGTGIVLDDVAAGVYGLIVMQLLLRFGILG